MAGFDLSKSYLLSQFRDFYEEAVRLKQQARAGAWVFQARSEGEGGEGAEKPEQLNALIGRLTELLERQALDATRLGGEYGAALYRDAQYVMAALADEIFLHEVDWDLRQAWTDNLIEARLFGSNVAGDQVFSRIDELLRRRDPVYAELAMIYFFALSAGFRGKYRGRDDQGRIALLKRQLYEFAFRRAPDLENEGKQMFADAYLHTLQEGARHRLPHLRRWVAALVIVVAVLLGMSHVVWVEATRDLTHAVDNLLAGSGSRPVPQAGPKS